MVNPVYGDQRRHRYKAQVIASDLTGRRLLVLPRDAEKLGIERADSFEVALAVRMSSSIPFYFEPVKFRNPKTGREHLIVDGGVLSNFPVWMFDADGEPRWPTFGLRLVESEPRMALAGRLGDAVRPTNRIEVTVEYVKSLVHTMLEAHDRLYIEMADFARTISASPPWGYGWRTSTFRENGSWNSTRRDARRRSNSWRLGASRATIREFRRGDDYFRRREAARRMRRAAEDNKRGL